MTFETTRRGFLGSALAGVAVMRAWTAEAGAETTDQETPQLRDIQGVSYRWGGDEPGILQFKEPSRGIEIGDKVLLVASHCDPTVNLYDNFYPYRDETVTALWPIAARGRSQ